MSTKIPNSETDKALSAVHEKLATWRQGAGPDFRLVCVVGYELNIQPLGNYHLLEARLGNKSVRLWSTGRLTVNDRQVWALASASVDPANVDKCVAEMKKVITAIASGSSLGCGGGGGGGGGGGSGGSGASLGGGGGASLGGDAKRHRGEPLLVQRLEELIRQVGLAAVYDAHPRLTSQTCQTEQPEQLVAEESAVAFGEFVRTKPCGLVDGSGSMMWPQNAKASGAVLNTLREFEAAMPAQLFGVDRRRGCDEDPRNTVVNTVQDLFVDVLFGTAPHNYTTDQRQRLDRIFGGRWVDPGGLVEVSGTYVDYIRAAIKRLLARQARQAHHRLVVVTDGAITQAGNKSGAQLFTETIKAMYEAGELGSLCELVVCFPATVPSGTQAAIRECMSAVARTMAETSSLEVRYVQGPDELRLALQSAKEYKASPRPGMVGIGGLYWQRGLHPSKVAAAICSDPACQTMVSTIANALLSAVHTDSKLLQLGIYAECFAVLNCMHTAEYVDQDGNLVTVQKGVIDALSRIKSAELDKLRSDAKQSTNSLPLPSRQVYSLVSNGKAVYDGRPKEVAMRDLAAACMTNGGDPIIAFVQKLLAAGQLVVGADTGSGALVPDPKLCSRTIQLHGLHYRTCTEQKAAAEELASLPFRADGQGVSLSKSLTLVVAMTILQALQARQAGKAADIPPELVKMCQLATSSAEQLAEMLRNPKVEHFELNQVFCNTLSSKLLLDFLIERAELVGQSELLRQVKKQVAKAADKRDDEAAFATMKKFGLVCLVPEEQRRKGTPSAPSKRSQARAANDGKYYFQAKPVTVGDEPAGVLVQLPGSASKVVTLTDGVEYTRKLLELIAAGAARRDVAKALHGCMKPQKGQHGPCRADTTKLVLLGKVVPDRRVQLEVFSRMIEAQKAGLLGSLRAAKHKFEEIVLAAMMKFMLPTDPRVQQEVSGRAGQAQAESEAEAPGEVPEKFKQLVLSAMTKLELPEDQVKQFLDQFGPATRIQHAEQPATKEVTVTIPIEVIRKVVDRARASTQKDNHEPLCFNYKGSKVVLTAEQIKTICDHFFGVRTTWRTSGDGYTVCSVCDDFCKMGCMLQSCKHSGIMCTGCVADMARQIRALQPGQVVPVGQLFCPVCDNGTCVRLAVSEFCAEVAPGTGTNYGVCQRCHQVKAMGQRVCASAGTMATECAACAAMPVGAAKRFWMCGTPDCTQCDVLRERHEGCDMAVCCAVSPDLVKQLLDEIGFDLASPHELPSLPTGYDACVKQRGADAVAFYVVQALALLGLTDAQKHAFNDAFVVQCGDGCPGCSLTSPYRMGCGAYGEFGSFDKYSGGGPSLGGGGGGAG